MAYNSWMPIYWSDYLADTMALSTAEHGAYLLLIAHLWTTKSPIPDDDKMLARITRCSPEQWSEIRPVVVGFFSVSRGKWTHKRVTAELERAAKIHEKRVEAGRKRASKVNDLPAHGQHMTQPGYTQPQPQPQPQLSKITTTEKITESGADAPSRKAPKTRLPENWKPTEKDCAYAKSLNLTREETVSIARSFHRYWTGPDAKNPRKSDWHSTWCNWVDRDASRVIASRGRAAGGSANYSGERGSGIVASARRVLAALDAEEREGHADAGIEAANPE